ncbi:MAG TPA: hypothetical protein VGL76_03320 [Gaiellaceae bacterium]
MFVLVVTHTPLLLIVSPEGQLVVTHLPLLPCIDSPEGQLVVTHWPLPLIDVPLGQLLLLTEPGLEVHEELS